MQDQQSGNTVHSNRVRLWMGGLAALGLMMAVAGCADPNQTSGQANSCAAGQKLGGIWGAKIGDIVASRTPSIFPSWGGGVAQRLGVPDAIRSGGGLVGSQIGCALTAGDQKKAADAVQVATVTGHTQTWTGDEPGVSGQAQVIAKGGTCRTVRQSMTLGDGSQRNEVKTLCKGTNGWEEAQR